MLPCMLPCMIQEKPGTFFNWGGLFHTMDLWSFHFVIKSCMKYHETKQWRALSIAVAGLKEMMSCLDRMYTRSAPNSTQAKTAKVRKYHIDRSYECYTLFPVCSYIDTHDQSGLLTILFSSSIPHFLLMAKAITNMVFYERDLIDLIPMLLRQCNWKIWSRWMVADLVEAAHVVIKISERAAEDKMYENANFLLPTL